MTWDGINANAQNLGIESGELWQISVERRDLSGSSRRPVQRMKCQHHVPFAAIIAEAHFVDALAESPGHIIPGHDPLVLERYPAPSPDLQGVVARLD